MGRYAYENDIGFEYKFAFGSQSSNLGIILEEILDDKTYATIDRFINDDGEIARVDIYDADLFIEFLKDYLTGFVEPTKEQWDKWSNMDSDAITENNFNHIMIKKLLDCYKQHRTDYLEFDIEY